MSAVEGREPALAALGQPLPTPIRDARREGTPGQLIPPYELALADFARHLSLSARQRTAGAYLDTLQRLLGFGLDPLQAERSELERFLARARRGHLLEEEGRKRVMEVLIRPYATVHHSQVHEIKKA